MTVIAEITKPGLSTTIQDLGRPGKRHLGVPLSGAADFVSMALANAAVGNPPHAAGLECTLNGPTIRFSHAAKFAIGGADMPATLNGQPVSRYASVDANAGDELVLGAANAGARAYIAFAGGVGGDEFLGSRSTYVAAALGGCAGRALQRGDQLIGAGLAAGATRDIAKALQPSFTHDFILRVVAGPEALALDAHELEIFFSAKWTLTRRADRMGAELDGPKLNTGPPATMASSPVFPGIVQLPPGGAPFLLLSDAQTVGGYPRIAQVIAADLPLVGQVRPGDHVWFRKTTPDAARDIALKKSALYRDYILGGFFR